MLCIRCTCKKETNFDAWKFKWIKLSFQQGNNVEMPLETFNTFLNYECDLNSNMTKDKLALCSCFQNNGCRRHSYVTLPIYVVTLWL